MSSSALGDGGCSAMTWKGLGRGPASEAESDWTGYSGSGFCNGANVEVVRRAPLGDPIEFRLRGYHLSLRGEQAAHVQIVRA